MRCCRRCSTDRRAPAHCVATSPPRQRHPGEQDDGGAGSADALEPEDLEVGRTPGVGAFGRVDLATANAGRAGADADADPSTPPKTCDPKCLSKRGIVDSSLWAHVVCEKKITAKLHHTFILKSHGADQDDHTAYFLLEIPLRGEIFRVLPRPPG